MSVEVGHEAPDFELKNQFGTPVSLSSYRGHQSVLLVFFPKAFTATCAGELSAIRAENLHVGTGNAGGTAVLAISCDTEATLKAFATAEGLDFPLLSDFWPHGQVCCEYGVFLGERGFALRATFVIDQSGIVRWSVVNSPDQVRSVSGYRVALAAL